MLISTPFYDLLPLNTGKTADCITMMTDLYYTHIKTHIMIFYISFKNMVTFTKILYSHNTSPGKSICPKCILYSISILILYKLFSLIFSYISSLTLVINIIIISKSRFNLPSQCQAGHVTHKNNITFKSAFIICHSELI